MMCAILCFWTTQKQSDSRIALTVEETPKNTTKKHRASWHWGIKDLEMMITFSNHNSTSSHQLLWNAPGLCAEPKQYWILVFTTVNREEHSNVARFQPSMQTICRPCHSQACQCSALVAEGKEIIQRTLKCCFRPDFKTFDCIWLYQLVQLHLGKQSFTSKCGDSNGPFTVCVKVGYVRLREREVPTWNASAKILAQTVQLAMEKHGSKAENQ